MDESREPAASSHRLDFPLLRRMPAWAMIATATALVSFGGLAARGVSDNGERLASQLAWRFTMLAYLFAIIAGPLGRLISRQRLAFYRERRQFVWGFCASFGIFLATVLLPNSLPATSVHGAITIGMLLFLSFGIGVSGVTAYAAGPQAALRLGESARRALLGVGLSYFWLAYLLSSLAHLSNPQRPDAFYAASATLLTAALLLRLADSVTARRRLSPGDKTARS
jgi:hypothetical protein